MSAGYRNPLTFKKLPLLDFLPLTCHVLNLDRLAREFKNEEMHQYVYELTQGGDPRESAWFKRRAP